MPDVSRSAGSSFALLLHGLLGTLRGGPSATLSATLRRRNFTGHSRVPVREDFLSAVAACAASHIHHIVDANAVSGGVDVFVHSWNPSVGDFMDQRYRPHLRASLHEELVFTSPAEKARSQALSIGRAAALMQRVERQRGQPYTLCLVLRSDLLVGARVDLRAFEPAYVWFAEHCCIASAANELTRALVRHTCSSYVGPRGAERQTDANASYFRRRVLGPCRLSTTIGGPPSRRLAEAEDLAYFVMDWWFAARPDVVATWHAISERWWLFYRRRLQSLGVYTWASHAVWAIHVHDALNLSTRVRFTLLRVNTVRTSYARLRTGSRFAALGPFVTDPIGHCPVLHTLTNASVSTTALLSAALPADSDLVRRLTPRFATMARACAAASLPPAKQVVCCGEPLDGRLCGRQLCNETEASAEANMRFWQAGEGAVRHFRASAQAAAVNRMLLRH